MLKLAPVILTCSEKFITAKEAEKTGFARIELAFDDSDHHNIPTVKAFYGNWIFSPKEPIRPFEEAAYDREVNYAVREAVRQRGVPVEELDV